MKLIRVRFIKEYVNGIPEGTELSYHEAHANNLIKNGFAVEISDDGPGNGKDCDTCNGEQDITEETPKAGKAKAGKKNTITKDSIE